MIAPHEMFTSWEVMRQRLRDAAGLEREHVDAVPPD
jgi:hypothetical protein